MLRIVFDLDGVIAGGTEEDVYSDKAGWAYDKCVPIQNGIDVVRALYKDRAYIVINTARWESDREKTVKWLREHSVPYDELLFGKPFGHLYVDDRSFPPFKVNEGEATRTAAAMILEAARNRDATRCPV